MYINQSKTNKLNLASKSSRIFFQFISSAVIHMEFFENIACTISTPMLIRNKLRSILMWNKQTSSEHLSISGGNSANISATIAHWSRANPSHKHSSMLQIIRNYIVYILCCFRLRIDGPPKSSWLSMSVCYVDTRRRKRPIARDYPEPDWWHGAGYVHGGWRRERGFVVSSSEWRRCQFSFDIVKIFAQLLQGDIPDQAGV